jgi:uncharacterized protein YfbU (UPF0304 family)
MEINMELSAAEKLLLANQYEILKRVDPAQAQRCDLLLTCIYEGYDDDLQALLPHFEESLDEQVRVEVREILEMFRALYPPRHASHSIEPPAIFAGFDGNEESDYYAYARFLLEDRGLWRESRTAEYNSHTNMLTAYRNMLREWNLSADKQNLSAEDIERIVGVAPYLSMPRESR